MWHPIAQGFSDSHLRKQRSGILSGPMPEESTTPDPVQRWRDAFAAATAEELDGVTASLARNAVWEMDEAGLGPSEGVDAIRAFLLEWWSLWEEHNHHVEEVHVLSDIEVVAAEAPTKIVEHNVGAKGRRHGTGTYTLEALPSGGTRVNLNTAGSRCR